MDDGCGVAELGSSSGFLLKDPRSLTTTHLQKKPKLAPNHADKHTCHHIVTPQSVANLSIFGFHMRFGVIKTNGATSRQTKAFSPFVGEL